jgi:diaminopimelate epimerase
MQLHKLHGLGNDYLVVSDDAGHRVGSDLARALCDRHTGPGADGVLVPLRSEVADWGVRILNPDGSDAEKSGNGLRILARFLVDHRGAPRDLSIETPAGVVQARVRDDTVEVDMGQATLVPAEIPATASEFSVTLDGRPLACLAVGMGNPHCVVFLDTDVDSLPWPVWGAVLESDARFPNRTNVQFVQALSPTRLKVRIWERGAGVTLSSGSSASAVAVAALVSGRIAPGWVQVEMNGGVLDVEVDASMQVQIRGPVEAVGVILISPRWIQRFLSLTEAALDARMDPEEG